MDDAEIVMTLLDSPDISMDIYMGNAPHGHVNHMDS